MIFAIKNTAASALLIGVMWTTGVFAKQIVNQYGVVENGKMPESMQRALANDVVQSKSLMSNEHYVEVVADPQRARNDQERLAALSAREVFILVDRSGSMDSEDQDPTGSGKFPWTRWDSARVAAESIAELSLSLDKDNKVDVMLWTGKNDGSLMSEEKIMTSVRDIGKFFAAYKPNGTTPLGHALEKIYTTHLRSLLEKSEPFTVIILTDGCPNDPAQVKNFFKKVIRENSLEQKGRETLAAFSFVRIGDDPGATHFLEDLDDNLISQLGVNVDIVDTKEDNFMFGTGKYLGKDGVGPLALFWDAIYD